MSLADYGTTSPNPLGIMDCIFSLPFEKSPLKPAFLRSYNTLTVGEIYLQRITSAEAKPVFSGAYRFVLARRCPHPNPLVCSHIRLLISSLFAYLHTYLLTCRLICSSFAYFTCLYPIYTLINTLTARMHAYSCAYSGRVRLFLHLLCLVRIFHKPKSYGLFSRIRNFQLWWRYKGVTDTITTLKTHPCATHAHTILPRSNPFMFP